MKKRILGLILALCVIFGLVIIPVHAASSGTCGDNLTWKLDGNGTLTISGSGAMTNYSSYSPSLPWYSSLSSVKRVIMQNGVTSIGGWAFSYCSSLTSITIPASVTNIGNSAFYYCINLTSINVDSNNKNYSSQDGVLFNKDKTTLIYYPNGKIGAYTIPSSVTNIGNSAFSYCRSLTSITIPASVTNIGNSAFYYCINLTSINVDSNNKNYSSQDGVLFNKDKTTQYIIPMEK